MHAAAILGLLLASAAISQGPFRCFSKYLIYMLIKRCRRRGRLMTGALKSDLVTGDLNSPSPLLFAGARSLTGDVPITSELPIAATTMAAAPPAHATISARSLPAADNTFAPTSRSNNPSLHLFSGAEVRVTDHLCYLRRIMPCMARQCVSWAFSATCQPSCRSCSASRACSDLYMQAYFPASQYACAQCGY